MIRAVICSVFLIVVLAPYASAQTPATPGESGTICFIERGTVAGVTIDQFTVVVTALAAGAPPGALPAASVWSIGLLGSVETSLNRRGQQSPKEAELLVVETAAGAIAFVYTFIPGLGPTVESIDFRQPVPLSSFTVLPGGAGGPFDILNDAANNQVVVSSVDAAGNVIVSSIDYTATIGNFTTADAAATGQPSTFAERLAIDPATGNILVPLVNGIDVLDSAMAGVVFLPTDLDVCTNIETTFDGAAAVNCIVGLCDSDDAGPSLGGWFAFTGDGLNQVTGTFTVGAPFFGALTLSPGFTEIGMDTNAAGTTATFLLSDNGVGVNGPGAVGQIINDNVIGLVAGPEAPVLAGRPFGNPTDGEPSFFMVSGAAGDEIGAVGCGGLYAYAGLQLGFAAPTTPLVSGGAIDPAHISRPQPILGLVNPTVSIATSVAPFPVAAESHAIAAPAAVPVQPAFLVPAAVAPIGGLGPMTSVSSRLRTVGASRGGTFPAVPLIAQSFTNPAVGSTNDMGYHVLPPNLAPTVAIPTPVSMIPIASALPPGAFLLAPATPASQSTAVPPGPLGIRDPQFVWNAGSLWAAFVDGFPGGSTLRLYDGTGAPVVPDYFYASNLVGSTIVTELSSF